MIRRTALLLITLSLICVPVLAAYPPEPLKGWSYFKPVQVTGNNQYTALFLDKEVYRYANPNLSDIRITDETGTIVPYAIINANETILGSPNRQYEAVQTDTYQKNHQTVFDYQIKTSPSEDALINSLTINILSKPYLVRCLIYGSYDGLFWEGLGEHKIYSVDGITNNRVNFGQGLKYSYYRVVIQNNLDNLKIQSLIPEYQSSVSEVYLRYKRSTSLTYKNQTQGKDSIIRINNPNHLRIESLKLTVAGNFRRNYELWREDNQPGYPIAQGTFYQLTLKNDRIDNTSIIMENVISSPVLKLRIQNQDNNPLNITGITAVYDIDRLIMEYQLGRNYRLFCGNSASEAPIYDIEYFKQKIEKSDLNEGTLGPAQSLSHKKAVVRNPLVPVKAVFNGLMIIISLLLIGIIANIIRKSLHT